MNYMPTYLINQRTIFDIAGWVTSIVESKKRRWNILHSVVWTCHINSCSGCRVSVQDNCRFKKIKSISHFVD